MNVKFAFAVLAGFAAAGTAVANEFEPQLRELAAGQIAAVASDPAVIEALLAQNAAMGSMAEPEIIALDNAWRAEVGAGDQPTITPVLENSASEFLRGQRDASAGLFTEIFVMDQNGLNVAASDITSDYWQGDEAKWQETYAAGAGAVHISEVELDESTQTYQAQVSVTVVDPESGAPIGAITFGVDVGMIY